jgi:hypothetical protein
VVVALVSKKEQKETQHERKKQPFLNLEMGRATILIFENWARIIRVMFETKLGARIQPLRATRTLSS